MVMRSIQVLEKIPFAPGVCVNCGVGDSSRVWYADMGFALDQLYNPQFDGNVYVCNECWNSIAREINKQAQLFIYHVEPWQGDEFVPPTYEDTTELEFLNGTGREQYSIPDDTEPATESDPEPIAVDSSTNGGNPEPEVSNPEPGPSPSVNESVDDFRQFFGIKSSG